MTFQLFKIPLMLATHWIKVSIMPTNQRRKLLTLPQPRRWRTTSASLIGNMTKARTAASTTSRIRWLRQKSRLANSMEVFIANLVNESTSTISPQKPSWCRPALSWRCWTSRDKARCNGELKSWKRKESMAIRTRKKVRSRINLQPWDLLWLNHRMLINIKRGRSKLVVKEIGSLWSLWTLYWRQRPKTSAHPAVPFHMAQLRSINSLKWKLHAPIRAQCQLHQWKPLASSTPWWTIWAWSVPTHSSQILRSSKCFEHQKKNYQRSKPAWASKEATTICRKVSSTQI